MWLPLQQAAFSWTVLPNKEDVKFEINSQLEMTINEFCVSR